MSRQPFSNPSQQTLSYYGTPVSQPPQDLPFQAPTGFSVPSYHPSYRDSASTSPYADVADGTPTNSAPLLPADEFRDPNYPTAGFAAGGALRRTKDEVNTYADAERHFRPFYKRPWFWVVSALAVAAVVAAVVIPVILVAHHNSDKHSTSAASSSNGGGKSGSGGGGGNGGNGGSTNTGNNLATWGGDGSTVTKDDGSTFVYHNQFGGLWVSDPSNPFNNSAKPNSWTPALSEEWVWGVNRVNGVNLGGLFVLEPFIIPKLYQDYAPAQDEWSLAQIITQATNASSNLTQVLSDHYSTFITEDDIAQIAGAGLNFVRIPIPFWAIETWADVGNDGVSLAADGSETGGTGPVSEPFLAKVAWGYILKVLGWCRKYGIRVNLDMHTAPGSQNGYNHSGKVGQVNFMNGVMGVANAQRMLDYIRVVTEFISQPEYQGLIPMFSIINEALLNTIGADQMTSFYLQAHDIIRSITGVGEGHGPYMVIHDGFQGLSRWSNFLPGSDRIAMDTHPYFAFDGNPNGEPIAVPADGGDGIMPGGQWPQQACKAWGSSLNASRANFGVTIAGEFSNGINDCGLFVRGTKAGSATAAPCDVYNDWQNWNQTMKDGFKNYMLASMDALGDYFFWTWKIGNDSASGTVQAPLWSYQLGLENGWIPTDPREAQGMCARLGTPGTQFSGVFQPWQTGGAGAGTIAPSATAQFGTFPPTSLAGVPVGQVPLLPTYTATRAPVTLPPPAFTQSVSVSVGDGWANAADTAQMVTAVQGCVYPDAWNAQGSPVPSVACPAPAGGAAPTVAPVPVPSPAPSSVAGAAAVPSSGSTAVLSSSSSSVASAAAGNTASASAPTPSTSSALVPPVRR